MLSWFHRYAFPLSRSSSVHIRINNNTLYCRERDVAIRIISFPFLPPVVCVLPSFANVCRTEFDNNNGTIATLTPICSPAVSAVDEEPAKGHTVVGRVYKVWDMLSYKFIFAVHDDDVNEIKISYASRCCCGCCLLRVN